MFNTSSLRLSAVALLTGGLLLPASAFAAPAADVPTPGTGTLVGSITCGSSDQLPAPQVVVAAQGIDLQTVTNSSGQFTLSGLPAGQVFTIEAIADPQASSVAARSDIEVGSGQTLDIGALNLGICGQPQPAMPTDQDVQTQDNSTNDSANN
jgi:hypothetical protein